MAKTNFQRQKDQKDQAKRRKKEEKLQRKSEKGNAPEGVEGEIDGDGTVASDQENTSENAPPAGTDPAI